MDPADIAACQALKNKRPGTVGEVRQLTGFLGYSANISQISAVNVDRCMTF